MQISKLNLFFNWSRACAKNLGLDLGLAAYVVICKDNFLKQQRSIATKCEFLAWVFLKSIPTSS